ncbi:MAG TPA: hypothetical protein VL201_01030 [Patescibacteria group bacterium]|nr:hypothetical protein [Patescibacteria group bacterium]
MKGYKKGSIVFIMLCMNIWCLTLITLLIQIVGLAHYVTIKRAHTLIDEQRFDLLIYIARQYINEHKIEDILDATIFNSQVVLDGIDTFDGKIHLGCNEKRDIITINVSVNKHKKTIQETL